MFQPRVHPRRTVRLPCRIQTKYGDLSSFTLDISLGGLGAELPPIAGLLLRDTPITAVAIADLPPLPVTVRWRTDARFGAKFVYPDRAAPFIAGLMDSLPRETGALSPPGD